MSPIGPLARTTGGGLALCPLQPIALQGQIDFPASAAQLIAMSG